MAPVIPARLKKGGYFITSGIIDFKENDVKEAIEKAGIFFQNIRTNKAFCNIRYTAKIVLSVSGAHADFLSRFHPQQRSITRASG